MATSSPPSCSTSAIPTRPLARSRAASFGVSTLGGNAAENAGGPRCLKYGTTTNHVRAIEAVMPDGTLARFSRGDAGPELLSLLIGAEGTLGERREVLIRQLSKKFGLTDEERGLIEATDDLDRLAAALDEILFAETKQQVLDKLSSCLL